MKIYVCHSCGYDYENELYKPIRNSSLSTENEIFLPHENGNEAINTIDIIRESDLIIAEVSHPSTGQGIELGRAEVFGRKVLCLYKAGSKYSGSLRFITNNFVEYTDSDELIVQIESFLKKQP